MKSIFLSVVAIVFSAVPGTLLAWTILGPLDWPVIWKALVVLPVALVFSVAIFAAMHVVGRRFGILKP